MMEAAKRHPQLLPVLALVVTVIAWGSAFVAIRSVGEHISPAPMALGRLLVASAVLIPLAAIRGYRLPRGKTLGLVVAYGVLWFALYTVLVNAAEQHLDAGTTAMLVNIAPIIVAVTAGIVLHEGFPPLLFVGIVVSFLGVAIIALGGESRRDILSMTFAVVAAIIYGLATVAQKVALRETDPLTATTTGAAIGAVTLLPFAPRLVHELAAAPVGSSLGVLYLGLVPTALAFLTFAYALKHTSAGVTASSTYAAPAVTILLSWLLLSEAPTSIAIIGGALALVGVGISRIHPRRRTSATGDTTPAQPSADGGPELVQHHIRADRT